MVDILVILIFCLIFNSIHTIKSNYNSNTGGERYISYQVHSFNDIRQWPQLFYKNITWMKIDPNYRTHEECLQQTRVSHDDPRGCFILNHDDPQFGKSFRNDYNSTDDLVHMVHHPDEFPYLFSQKIQQKIHIALCFKFRFGNPCDNSTYGTNWLSLVTDLVKDLSDGIIKNHLQLEFILDGAATPGGTKPPRECLSNLWRNLNSTYIPMDDPVDGMVNNDEGKGNDRFQVLNIPYADFPLVQLLHFGKFNEKEISKSRYSKRYPVLIWEPSNQGEIVAFAMEFLDKSPVEVPLRFAINIEPVQFQIYSSSSSKETNGYAWNIFMENTFDVSSHFKISSIPSKSEIGFFVVIYLNTPDSSYRFMVVEGNPNFGKFEVRSGGKLNEVFTSSELVWVNVVEKTKLMDVGFSSGEIFTFSVSSSSSFTFRFVKKWEIGVSNQTLFYSMERILVDGKSYIISSSKSKNCALSINLSGDQESQEESRSVCLIKNLKSDFEVSTATSSSSSEILVMFNERTQTFIRGAIISIIPSSSNLNFDLRMEYINDDTSYLDIGSAPQLSILHDVVLETHGNGYCYNNERNNKRADSGVCDLQAKALNEILVYNYGTFSVFKEAVKQQMKLDVCSFKENRSTFFVHGMYDQGFFTSSVMYECPKNEKNEICLIEVHKGVTRRVEGEAAECGTALVHDGLVFDSWILPQQHAFLK